MIDLVLQSPDLESFLPGILSDGREGCVILFTRAVAREGLARRLLASDFVLPDDSDYVRRGRLEAELAPSFVARITKYALRKQFGLVFVHSHPGDRPPRFSKTDDLGERHLAAFLQRRLPDSPHVALVISAGGFSARVLGSAEPVRVVDVGARRRVVSDPNDKARARPGEQFDRQVRAFGASGQGELTNLRVAIVGLGGTGSIVAQQLAHLGVRDFLLVDPDTVAASNLNRLANAVPADLGQHKTAVAKRYIDAVAPGATVFAIAGDVTHQAIARHLTSVDFIFGCTDSHGSRAVLQQVAYQYLIPCIDMGSTIVVGTSNVTHVHGRVQMLAPGLPCLICSRVLDFEQVRRDMLTDFARNADPYIVGAHEPAPAVMSLNGTVASLAVTMLIAILTELPIGARNLLYDALRSRIRVIAHSQDAKCVICSRSGVLATGDATPLMARFD